MIKLCDYIQETKHRYKKIQAIFFLPSSDTTKKTLRVDNQTQNKNILIKFNIN